MPSTPIRLTPDLTDLIRLQRKEGAGLTQKGAALAAGDMSEVWWRQIEGGQPKTVPADTVARMCYAINVTPEQLRNIGEERVAELVERRRDILEPRPKMTPEQEIEAHLMATPVLPEKDRLVLVSVAFGLLQVRQGEASVSVAG